MNLGKKVMEKLSEETRNNILKIKHKLTKNEKYRREYRSVNIYKAVLEDGITNLEQWWKWWKNNKNKT